MFTFEPRELEEYQLPRKAFRPGRSLRQVSNQTEIMPEPPSPRVGYMRQPLSPTRLSGDKTVKNMGGEDWGYGEALLSKLKTGEDGIAFFAQQKSATTIKFLFLNRAPNSLNGRNFRPYDLVVVERSKVNAKEYFIMSEDGVSRVGKGQQTEVTPLVTWMREATIFNVLRSTKCFKHYLVNKMFKRWIAGVRFKLYCEKRQAVAKSLFSAKSAFCAPMMRIRTQLAGVYKVKVHECKTQKAFNVSAFAEKQEQILKDATIQFENMMDELQRLVEKTCESIMRRARHYRQLMEREDDYDAQERNRNKSLVVLKQERAERMRMCKLAKNDANTLGDFIRLIDYMITESFVEVSITTQTDLLEQLMLERKTGMFEAIISFAKGHVTEFNPNADDIISMLDTKVQKMIDIIQQVPRILFSRSLRPYLPKVYSGHQPSSLIVADKSFKSLNNTIEEKLRSDFREAAEYVKQFEFTREIWEFDMSKFSEKWDTFSPKDRISETRKSISICNGWHRDIGRIRAGGAIGSIYVESRKLKNSLIPIADGFLAFLKKSLATLAREKCSIVYQTIKERIKVLSATPDGLGGFSKFVSHFKNLSAAKVKLAQDCQLVDDLYRMLQIQRVRIVSDDAVQLDEMRNAIVQDEKLMAEANTLVYETMPEMLTQLDMNIANLNRDAEAIQGELVVGDFNDSSLPAEQVLLLLNGMKSRLLHLEKNANDYSNFQKSFGKPQYAYKILKETRSMFDLRYAVWNGLKEWGESLHSWHTCDFRTMVAAELNEQVNELFKNASLYDKKIKNEVTDLYKTKIQDFKVNMSCIMDLGNPVMKERHWERLFKVLGKRYMSGQSFTLARLVELKVYTFGTEVGEISAAASGEAQIEASVSAIADGWSDMEINVLPYRDSDKVFILGPLDEVMVLMEDNQVSLQTMMGSKFIMGVRDTVETWGKNLSILSDTFDEWLQCQKTWMYLETIFSAEDIQEQLPDETKLFKEVDKTWNTTMKATFDNPRIMAILEQDNPKMYLFEFERCNKILDEVQRSLENYLEVKRMAFPRFYFLSNDELLEILSQTRDPQAVQPHLSKCFDAMRSLTFGVKGESNSMLAMNSSEGEQVSFVTSVAAEGPVETWLSAVERAMRNSLREESRTAFKNYPEDNAINREEWLFAFPAQCIIMIDQLFWTKEVEAAARALKTNKHALSGCLDFIVKQIDAMVELVRGDLTKLQRKTLSATITLDVHGRDVVRLLVRKKLDSIDNFEWTRQLRYYWDFEINDCTLRQTNTRFLYAYEYLGNSMRLVVTPLTDLCYMTLTGALHLRFGGAPAGPAGTGKTETTKDLGKALARQVVVFNCSDGLDYKIMGRFFSGLAQAGAWACFDEFNRIDVEVLSVIAQQIQTIQQAISMDAEQFMFEGGMIPLNSNFGVFITMNPGYAGRTELPDNLKALFRPVAMMVPDYRMIAEIVLFSQGFANALPLSNKMSQLYQLSSEQLSKQDHYDFGMRAVKSVLVAAGQLKRKEPETNEDLLLIRAMRDSNVPKFLEQDLPLFRGILKDLFPGVEVPFVDYGKLQLAIENQINILNLQKVPAFISKVIQVHETQLVRHGMMVVGEPGSGKSLNALVLSNALAQLEEDGVKDKDNFFRAVHTDRLNPKSISAGQLYGEFNLMTGEWFDGLVPSLVRAAKADKSNKRHWILFDGPVDAVWIENMNTVLDDNKTLCLANSERIKMPDGLHMMFEVQDLSQASPATVSRCGMVFMEQVHVGLDALLDTWCETSGVAALPKNIGYLRKMLVNYVPKAIEFVNEKCNEKVRLSDCHRMSSMLNLLTCILTEERKVLDSKSNIFDLINNNFFFALVWAIGGNVTDESRPVFSDYITSALKSLLGSSAADIDAYDFLMDNENGSKTTWTNVVPKFTYDPVLPYFDLVVPTEDTTKYTFLLEAISSKSFNVLFLGETGIGKSIIIQNFLDASVKSGSLATCTVNYSAQTTPANVREVFETRLEKKRKNLLGPPAGKKMVVFVDDLNMPTLEEYGAQPPNELLRQVIDDKGYYDVEKVGLFKFVADTSFAAACAPPGGGRSDVTQRLVRHFHTIWLSNLSGKSMKRIFSAILTGFICSEMPSLIDASEKIVDASVEVYQDIQKGLLPTPSKSHYTYNLRDLSQVFQGLLMANSKSITSEENIVNLWLHEVARVFRDRLINETDRAWLNGCCKEMLNKYFSIELEVESFENIMFGDYLDPEKENYCELKSKDALHHVLNEQLEEFNITFSNRMNLVFFDDAMSHISRLARILRQPRGNALLVGVGGSGRKSLTRLASFMAGYRCTSIEITKTYDRQAWFDDLKAVLMEAGCKDQPVVFLFSDTQIVQEAFLEDINNLLNAGDIPNIYANEEIEKIIGEVRKLSAKAGKGERRDDVYAHYVSLVRQNLRVVLAFSPIGESFRDRCRMFPSLVNCCTIDWFDPWPEDALFSVADRFLGGNQAQELEIESFVEKLCTVAVRIHRSVEVSTAKYLKEVGRHNYTTPTSYLELLQLFQGLLKEKRVVAQDNLSRYENGLKKLKETEDLVEGLKVELAEMQPVLKQAKADTEELMVKLTKDQAEADEARGLAEKDQAAAEVVAKEVETIKTDCEADLAEAMPAYYSAVESLNALDKKSIQEIKSFANPPEMVEFTLNAVCIMMGSKPNWKEAKKLMNDMNFLDNLKTYDKDNIPKSKIKKLRPFMKNKNFTPEKVEKVSKAAKSLCMWVRAMHTYDRVAKTIAPKKKKLAGAEAQLAVVNAQLEEKQAQLRSIEQKLAELEEMFDASVQKKQNLEEKTRLTLLQMERAGKLMSGLAGEKLRWLDTVKSLNSDITNLVGNIAVAAGAVAYLGPFTAPFRNEMISEWVETTKSLNVPVDKKFDLQRILADPVEVREWTIQSLPADDFSIENGVFSTRGRRWPLMIDPQGQANRWIKNLFKEQNLQIIKLSDANFLRTLENAIRYGAPVLLENVQETLDPALEPILLKQIFKRGGQMLLSLGDSEVPYSDDFKFFITTKLPNPHYLPEICIKVTIVNFTVTLKGLEDQLLVDVVVHERPDLEQKKDQLVLSIASDKKELKDIEDKILYMLANASGNILDDEDLIHSLDASKETSSVIEERMAEAEVTTEEIFRAREGYRVVATRASILYFVIASLADVDPMYQYSLQYYQALYNMRLQKSEESDDLETRLAILQEDLTKSVFVNICRGLFERHKLLFAFRIAVDILKHRGEISAAEWQAVLVGPPAIEPEKELPASSPLHGCSLPSKVWVDLSALEEGFSAFGGVLDSINETHAQAWTEFINSPSIGTDDPPSPWKDKLSNLQKLLLLRIIRSDQLVFGIKKFIGRTLGTVFQSPPGFDLASCFADSTSSIPLIFVLSSGADPMDYLLQLATENDKKSTMRIVSLGQGQGPIAEGHMGAAALSGEWVCLQNCHLAVSWLGKLEKLLEESAEKSLHEEYRLWLTSMPTKAFPVSILQMGIKITNEPPQGLKANITRTFLDMSEDEYNSCTKTSSWRKLLYGLAFYNAAILERRKFGAIGWNIPYGWMNSDLKTAVMQLRLYLEEQESTPFDTLNVMVGDVTYGGRITDKQDKVTNKCILKNYFLPEALVEGYSMSESNAYIMPSGDATLSDIRKLITTLPDVEQPEVFGMHANASITYQQKLTNTFLNTAISMEAGGGGGGDENEAKDNERRVMESSKAMLDRLPENPFNFKAAHPKTFETSAGGGINSLGVFCRQECEQFQKLIKVIRRSLFDLQRALQGFIVMGPALEQVYKSFIYQRVPALWENAGYPCLKPLRSWTEDFFCRVTFLSSWVSEGPRLSYWLSGLFFPQGFLTSVLQAYARERSVAIDLLGFDSQVMPLFEEDVKEVPEYGSYIHGLFMQGAQFDTVGSAIVEADPGMLFSRFPVIWLKPTLKEDGEEDERYACPLYKTSIRAGTLSTTGHSTNFVVALKIPTAQPAEHWIRRGVAMLCMLDD
jgi:dynein heavy chain